MKQFLKLCHRPRFKQGKNTCSSQYSSYTFLSREKAFILKILQSLSMCVPVSMGGLMGSGGNSGHSLRQQEKVKKAVTCP